MYLALKKKLIIISQHLKYFTFILFRYYKIIFSKFLCMFTFLIFNKMYQIIINYFSTSGNWQK